MRKTIRKLSRQKLLSDQKGLTLIDVSVALMIIGLLVTPVLYALKEYKADRVSDDTTQNIAAVDTAIRNYFLANGFYPCPANPAINIDDPVAAVAATHGISQVNLTPGSEGACLMINAGGVAEGSVPHTELGLDVSQIYDGWGNKILYAVDPSRASSIAAAAITAPAPPNFAPPPAAGNGIVINEIPLVPNPALPLGAPECNLTDAQICANAIAGYAPGTPAPCNPAFIYPPIAPTTGVHYTLLSHGSDGRGAFNAAGNPVPGAACGAVSADDANCDGDDTYQSRQCTSNDIVGANYYDDYIVNFASQKTTNPVAMISESEGNPDGMGIGMQFTGINNDDPQREVDVIGNIKITDIDGITGDDKDGAARADDYCDITGDNCFDASLIGGSVLLSPCPEGQTMIGIRNNAAECEPVLSETFTAQDCPNGISSITGGTPTCIP